MIFKGRMWWLENLHLKLSLGNAIIGKTYGGYDFNRGDFGSIKGNHNSRKEATIWRQDIQRIIFLDMEATKNYGSDNFEVTIANILKGSRERPEGPQMTAIVG